MLDKEDAMEWPGTLAIVHSYIAYKAGKNQTRLVILHVTQIF